MPISTRVPASLMRATYGSPSAVAGVSTPPREGPPGSLSPSSESESAASETNCVVALFDGSPSCAMRPRTRWPFSAEPSNSHLDHPFRIDFSDGPSPGLGANRMNGRPTKVARKRAIAGDHSPQEKARARRGLVLFVYSTEVDLATRAAIALFHRTKKPRAGYARPPVGTHPA
jgi:hypothetical protein